jgi:thioredoxin reductase (NADPH)
MVHGAGRFLGELGILAGRKTLLTPVAAEPSEVLIVPTARLRAALDADPQLGDLVVRSYLLRRASMLGRGAALRVVGPGSSEETQRLRELLGRRDVMHSWIDLDVDAGAAEMLSDLGVDPEETPVLITRDGRVLRNPSERELVDALGLD